MVVVSGKDLRSFWDWDTVIAPAGIVKIISDVSRRVWIRSIFTAFPSLVVAYPEAPPIRRQDRDDRAVLWNTGVLPVKAPAVPAAARRSAVCLMVGKVVGGVRIDWRGIGLTTLLLWCGLMAGGYNRLLMRELGMGGRLTYVLRLTISYGTSSQLSASEHS